MPRRRTAPAVPAATALDLPLDEPLYADLARYIDSISGASDEGICQGPDCGKWFQRSQSGGSDQGQGRRFCSAECYRAWRRHEAAKRQAKRRPPASKPEARELYDALAAERALIATMNLPGVESAAESRTTETP